MDWTLTLPHSSAYIRMVISMENNLIALRKYMKSRGIAACIIPTADPHMSEYTCDHYKMRHWLCPFTGSAGTLVVTMQESGLWTDGRYYIQAEAELSGTETKLYKASEKDTVKIEDYLFETLSKDDVLGVDGRLFSKTHLEKIIEKLSKKSVKVDFSFDSSVIWKNRPPMPTDEAWVLYEKYCGESTGEKLERVREKMREQDIDLFVTAMADGVMWLYNLRGSDIESTPVALSYAAVTLSDAVIFIDKQKLSHKTQYYLKRHNIKIGGYDEIYDFLKSKKHLRCGADFSRINFSLASSMGEETKNVEDIVEHLKAVKNETELKNIKNAYIKENTALVKSFYEIYNSENITECDVVRIIEKHRKKLDGYLYPSFQTIAAYGANAAMMHYAPSENDCVKIKKSGMLLIDTGGQYMEGTTDTTRTLIMGEITKEEAHNYTLVLKANLALSEAVFKKGLAGRDVDILARSILYKEGLDYRCGTGHGVGYLLCVHEGPQRISPLCGTLLTEGMTVTDEPGVYTEGKYGIRIENHLAVKHIKKTQYGDFLGFEVLNFCPIGTKWLEKEILSHEEIDKINEYNDKCIEHIRQYLTKEELQWLKIFTKHI